MFAQVHTPQKLTPTELDGYLERGWFRMGQTIFTTNFLRVKSELFSTIWLRMLLTEYQGDNTQLKLFRRNAGFQTEIKRAVLTDEKEDLYALYKKSVPFQASESLHHLLYFGKKEADSIYSTYEVTVHDGNKLIACGFFDLGESSAQGIASFYDPSYKKYSLGKFLIYLKIQYCKNLNLTYFYPGYFVPGNPHFDYKLTIGRSVLEFFQLSSNKWLHVDTFSEESIPFQVMHNKLVHVHAILTQAAINNRVLKYEYFDVNLMPSLRDSRLFDFPVFVFFGNDADETIEPILVYDIRNGLYHLLSCIPVWKPAETNPDKGFYSNYFLASQEIYATSSEEEIAGVVVRLFDKIRLG